MKIRYLEELSWESKGSERRGYVRNEGMKIREEKVEAVILGGAGGQWDFIYCIIFF